MSNRRLFSLMVGLIGIVILTIIPECVCLDNADTVFPTEKTKSLSAAKGGVTNPSRWWDNITPTTMPTRRKRNPSYFPTSSPTSPGISPTASIPTRRTESPSNDDNCYDCPPTSVPDDDCVTPNETSPPMSGPPKKPPSKHKPKPEPKPEPGYSDDYYDGTGTDSPTKPPPKGKPKATAMHDRLPPRKPSPPVGPIRRRDDDTNSTDDQI